MNLKMIYKVDKIKIWNLDGLQARQRRCAHEGLRIGLAIKNVHYTRPGP